jgi:hypothetical protein
MDQQLARPDRTTRCQAERVSQKFFALLVLGALLVSGPAWAQGEAVEPPPATPATPLPAAAPPPPAPNPGLDVRTPTPEPARPSVFRRWWFWTAVGVAAAATVAVIVISSRGDAPPATDLGNQEFRP